MKMENYQDLLRTRREFKNTKNEARELELNPGGIIVEELQDVIAYSEGALEVFLNQNKDFIKSKLAKFGDFLNEISVDGRSAESTFYFSYGKENFLENCLSIHETYLKLQNYFYNIIRDPVFIEIRNNFAKDLIRIEYVSPNKSFEENVAFFRKKIDIYYKYGKNPREGYVSYLIDSIYYTDPEDYLRSLGYEV